MLLKPVMLVLSVSIVDIGYYLRHIFMKESFEWLRLYLDFVRARRLHLLQVVLENKRLRLVGVLLTMTSMSFLAIVFIAIRQQLPMLQAVTKFVALKLIIKLVVIQVCQGSSRVRAFAWEGLYMSCLYLACLP